MIHATALVEEGACLGDGVDVGPYAVIEARTEIGDGCRIGAHATIKTHTRLGAGCQVHAGAVLGDVPQDRSFGGEETFLRVGDRCVIREGVTLHRGTRPGTATEIGAECFLMAFAHCAHNVVLGPRVVLANGALLGGYAQVGEGAFISGNCLVHQFCKIGRLAMLGGGSGVSKDVPPFCTVKSLTANRLAGLNVVGLRRSGCAPAERQQIRRAFKLLYRSGRTVAEAIAEMRRTLEAPAALEFCAFVEQSERGVCGLQTGDGREDD